MAGLASYRADLCFREAHLLRELTEIRAVVGPGGTLRAVAPAERDHACEWMAAFFAEALPEEVVPLETLTDSLVASGDLFWLVAGGEIVSMAGAIRPTFTGASIAYVYTPIEQRGRGYGTAVTDRLCRRLLAGGRQRLWLFTVPENPISNHIYAKLGFEHVDDFALFSVVASPDGSGGLAR